MIPSQLAILIHWITEREAIRQFKEAGAPRPWTDDPILATWRFCNVNRCDDRETKWIFKHVIEAHSTSPALWFNLAVARFINWSPTLEKLGYFHGWNRDRFVEVISGIQGKAYTGAYMIPAGPSGVVKHDFLADYVFAPLWDLRSERPTEQSCASWDVFFRRVRCMGAFLRNQIITDMKYSHHLENAVDWSSFVLAGPGTMRGLNRLAGFPLTRKPDSLTAQVELLKLREVLLATNSTWEPLFDDLNNLSNCMCEYDKYCRVRNGEGKPRSRYVPYAGEES